MCAKVKEAMARKFAVIDDLTPEIICCIEWEMWNPRKTNNDLANLEVKGSWKSFIIVCLKHTRRFDDRNHRWAVRQDVNPGPACMDNPHQSM